MSRTRELDAPARRSIPAMPSAVLVADVDFPTPPLWLVKTKTRVMIENSSAEHSDLNETAWQTNGLANPCYPLGWKGR
jgi:hypothetical protein